MKLSIDHETVYTYDAPVRSSTQVLRLTPRPGNHQKVLDWKVELSGSATRTQDGYGNVLHVLTLDKPVSEIRIRARGTVETQASADEGQDGSGNPLSPLVFLRTTPLTRAEAVPAGLSEALRRNAGTLSGLRELAAAVLAGKRAEQQDTNAEALAHAFIASCRQLGVPARYVSGYVLAKDAAGEALQLHAWAEAWVVDRWRSFDIAAGTPAGERHVRIALGADYLDACPIRGVRTGGGLETMKAEARFSTA